MLPPAPTAHGAGSESLARAATHWLMDALDDTEHGQESADAGDVSLYHGDAGVLLALHEAHRHFGDPAYGEAAARAADRLTSRIETLEECSLYFGLAGVAVALTALGRDAAAARALSRVRTAYDGRGWGPMRELLMGNAGIALGALVAGDVELAVDAVAPYLSTADPTAYGVNWAVRPSPARSHHLAHGTLGIVYALARVGRVADRGDLVELALAGAADVVGRNEAGPDGFLVAHSDPPHRPDLIERHSYGWCNGPTGDARVFGLLGQVTGDPTWTGLGDACWHTVRASGLPQRLRPGFWDNNGRCCGTAGVLALACDRIVERDDDPAFAGLLVDDLAARATLDHRGARWSNHEHRVHPSALPPRTGWAMGNAGIIPELLRHARLSRGRGQTRGQSQSQSREGGYASPWPDAPRLDPPPPSTPS